MCYIQVLRTLSQQFHSLSQETFRTKMWPKIKKLLVLAPELGFLHKKPPIHCYREDSIKPPGAYLSEAILQVGAYLNGSLLNLQVPGPAMHNVLCCFLHSQIGIS